MQSEFFRTQLLKELETNIHVIQSNDKKDWAVKGFVDIYKNVYTISVDTKVISKILELMLFPTIASFANKHNLKMVLAKHQNYYPDISFVDESDGTMYAMDIKSTYKIKGDKVNGFTLGAFTGYFRNRDSLKNITFPYSKYNKHYVLGIVYTKQDDVIDERKVYNLEDLDEILSVVGDFQFILQEKYKLAHSRTGSGNTKNIGSITDINKLINGEGSFSKLGVEIFDDYWMYYQTKDMAQDGIVPYSNLKDYAVYKNKAPDINIVNSIEEEEPVDDY